jgi:predicted RNase H-like HicB family nuclease
MPKYSMNVVWSPRDRMFVATCPELGELSALGPSYESAARELEVAIGLAVESLTKRKMPLPAANELVDYSGQFRVRVPKTLHAWLADRARAEQVSLNSLVVAYLSEARGKATANAQRAKPEDKRAAKPLHAPPAARRSQKARTG